MHVNKISALIFFVSAFLFVGCKDKTTEQVARTTAGSVAKNLMSTSDQRKPVRPKKSDRDLSFPRALKLNCMHRNLILANPSILLLMQREGCGSHNLSNILLLLHQGKGQIVSPFSKTLTMMERLTDSLILAIR